MGNIDNYEDKTLGELYNIETTQAEDNTQITQLPLPNRVINGLMRNHIFTMSDLLKTRNIDLVGIRQLGQKSIEDIHQYLKEYCDSSSQCISANTNYAKAHASKAVKSYMEDIFAGKLGFTAYLNEKDKNTVSRLVESIDILGVELAETCYKEPNNVIELIRSLYEYCHDVENELKKSAEITTLFSCIPSDRHKQEVQGYIDAYTRDENIKLELSNVYSLNQKAKASLVDIDYDLIYKSDNHYVTLINFLKWCSFDIKTEIADLFEEINSRGNIGVVLQGRARGKTLQILGTELGITRERIRQLETKAKRIFGVWQGKKRILSQISAIRNSDKILSPIELQDYFGEYFSEMIYLLRSYESPTFTYDVQLDVFVLGDESLTSTVFAIVESLPSSFGDKAYREYVDYVIENDIPLELFEKILYEEFKKDGSTYHRIHQTLTDVYHLVMNNHFSQGINIYDEQEMLEFRRIAVEEYGCHKLPANDRAIGTRIQDICMMCDKGRYKPKSKECISKELANKIHAYISESSSTIFLTNILFSIFEEELVDCGVDNKYYLQGVLRELYDDEFFFRRDYISKDDSVTSMYSDLVQFVKKYNYPITRRDVYEAFPGLSDVVFNIAISDSGVLNLYGKYIHGSRLPITDSDRAYFKLVINKFLYEVETCHYGDLYEYIKRDDVDLLNRLFITAPTSLFSVLEYLFSNEFQFKRPFIAKLGVTIENPALQIKEMVLGSEIISIADVIDAMKESRYQVYSYLDYFNSYSDTHLLVNADYLATFEYLGIKDDIAMNVVRTVEKHVNECVPIRNLSCISDLPRINVPWHEWLVYGIIRRWSQTLEVGVSNSIFKQATPLVSLKGKMNTSKFAGQEASVTSRYVIDDLDNIDDLIEDIIDLNEIF